MCLCEAKASHSHKMWTEVSSSVPHLLQMGLLPIPIIHKCLLKVLCPVSRPIITLVWVLLKDNSRAPVARSGPEINSLACLCVLQGTCHNARCWFPNQRFKFLLVLCLETPKKGSGPTNRWEEPLLASVWAISVPLTPACPVTQYSPTACRAEMLFNACRHCRTDGNVVDGGRYSGFPTEPEEVYGQKALRVLTAVWRLLLHHSACFWHGQKIIYWKLITFKVDTNNRSCY